MTAIEAMFYEKTAEETVRCTLCPHHCRLKPGQVGLCRVRSNRQGILMTHNYGAVSSLAVDPIEKKPLYHFYPGTSILSAGSFGCNLTCSFCQNYHIAHETPITRFWKPEELVAVAVKASRQGSIGLAFTYNEPSIWYEYILAVAPLLKERDLKTVLISNGYIEKEPLEKLLPYIDAFNIDLKAFNKSFYPAFCKGKLQPVKDTIARIIGRVHVEITTLLVTGKNDQEEEIRELARWLASLDRHTVLHLSRYHPAYKLDLPPTSETALYRAREAAREYLDFVFIGNVPGEMNHTYCLQCGNELVQRSSGGIKLTGIKNRQCGQCNSVPDYIQGV